MERRIAIDEVVKIYKVEVSFIESLVEFGLLHPEIVNEKKYIIYEEIPALERFSNWHYDLDVNVPGLQIIHDLLAKIEMLHTENRRLALLEKHHATIWKESESF